MNNQRTQIKKFGFSAALLVVALISNADAAKEVHQVNIEMRKITATGIGADIGTIVAEDTPSGLRLKLQLANLPPGPHGFHVHQNPSCQPGEKAGKMVAGLAAGGHYDPHKTGAHKGPNKKGHLGDLPALVVDMQGEARHELLAPHLKVAEIIGRSLMIHEEGDTYSDTPKELGGGGKRIACGVIDEKESEPKPASQAPSWGY